MDSLRGAFHAARHTVLSLVLIMSLGMASARAETAGFSPTGSMGTSRTLYTATLLQNGTVLVVGGTDGSTVLNSAELYDPAKGTFTVTGSMVTSRQNHTATLLADGKVLITGGDTTSTGTLKSAELYDPQSGTFTQTGSMGAVRASHTATRLQDGKVLIAGGSDGSNSLDSSELYDPTKGTFFPAGIMFSARHNHTATLLKNGKILLAGGLYVSTYFDYFATSTWSVELYDPAQGTFTQTGNMLSQRQKHTATLLDNGTVLITGGSIEFSGWCMGCGPVKTAELYDPASGTFTLTGDMNVERTGHTATRLGNGTVLVTGGWAPSWFCYGDGYAELYDPAAGTFAVNAPLDAGSNGPATLLQDGRVLVQGAGGSSFVYNYVKTALLTVDSSGGSVNISEASTGNFAGITYSPKDIRQGCILISPLALTYMTGTTVTLTAPATSLEGNWFVRWDGCDTMPGAGDLTCTVTVGSNRTATAFYAQPVDITLESSPLGLLVDIDGGLAATPVTVTWVQGSIHGIGTPSPQTFIDGSEYVFTSWSDGGGQWHMVTPAVSQTLVASFTPKLLPARVTPVSFPTFIGATYYQTIFDAYAGAFSGATIEAKETVFVGDLTLNLATDVSVIGGYDAVYSSNRTGMTTVQGRVTIATGSLVADRLAVK